MFGYDDLLESQLLGFGDALLDAAHGTYLARQAHLARHAYRRFNLGVHIAREDGTDDAQVDGRIVHPESARDVQEHILLCQFESHTLLQYRQQHVHAPQVKSRGRTLRRTVGRRAHERLRLDEEGTYPLNGRGNGNAAHPLVTVREEQLRRVAHLAQTIATHLVDTQFGRTSETILDAAQDTVHIVLVALKLQHTVHDMLQYLRSRDATLLVDMSDEDSRNVALLGKLQQRGCTFAYLYDATRRRLRRLGRDRLYRVNDDDVRLRLLDVRVNLLQRRLAHDQTVRLRMADAVGAQLQLSCALLTRNV